VLENNMSKITKDLMSICFIRKTATSINEIILKNIIPDALSYSYSPNFSSQSMLGRMSPIQMYTGGSAKTYSFSITLHEDYLYNTKYNRLDDLVDDIKSLSYPVVAGGITSLPTVEFYIGEISGKGIVQTSSSWKKPFRDGRYILVDLSITITVEEIYPLPNFKQEITEAGEDLNVQYTGLAIVTPISESTIYWAYDSSIFLPVNKYGIVFDKYVNESVYVNPRDTLSADPAIKFFEVRILLLNNYKNLADVSSLGSNKDYQRLSDSLKSTMIDLTNVLSSVDTLRSIKYKDFIELVDAAKELYIDYLDYYFWHGNTEMRSGEFDLVVAEIENQFDSIIRVYQEVIGYGAGS